MMEEKDFHIMLEVFVKGTELNIGIHPHTNVVKYGYCYFNNDLTLYLQASGENTETIKNYIETNKEIHFNKWSGDGRYVSGYGNAAILEKEDEKIEGLKIIMKQQTGNDNINIFNHNEINDLFIFKLSVQKIHLLKH